MIDEQLDIALKDDITLLDNAKYELNKDFIENIKTHFRENNDELKYIRFQTHSRMYSTKICCKHNLSIIGVDFNEYEIDIDALYRACSSNTLGLAVGDKICRLITFYEPNN